MTLLEARTRESCVARGGQEAGAIMIRIVAISALSFISLCSSALAETSTGARHCAALTALHNRYGTLISLEGFYEPATAEVAWALANCDGTLPLAIQVLEDALRNGEVKQLPRQASAPAPAIIARPSPAPAPATPIAGPLTPEERLAARRGDALAQYNLGRRYERGEGVPQDYAVAHMWYSLSAASSASISATAAQACDQLERQSMEGTSVAEARELARQWKPAN
jgi:hypothetical protein